MEKVMNSYETLFVVDATLAEEAVKATVEKFTALISENGTIDSVDEWGKRRLAYPINDENDGYYVLYNYECNAEFPKELDRVVGITDGVLRSLIIKK
jgi:small subunit ribosomal protein S6